MHATWPLGVTRRYTLRRWQWVTVARSFDAPLCKLERNIVNPRVVTLIRLILAVSTVATAVLPAFAPVGQMTRYQRYGFFAAALLATISSMSNVVTDPLGVLVRHGMRGLYPRGSESTPAAQRRIQKAAKSVKILDTYWGQVNQFRSVIESAFGRSHTTTVQILLARPGGCVAQIRDIAMPGQTEVDLNLESCIANVLGLQKHLAATSSGWDKRVAVRFYDAVVMGPMIIVDDKHAIVGTFLQSGGSPVTPAFEFGPAHFGSSSTVEHFVASFDALWKLAGTDVDLESLPRRSRSV
jgi:hypothetical protein